MIEHYPRIRRYGPTRQGEQLLIREVVHLVFYMPHDHVNLATGVSRALDSYIRAVGEGPETVCGWAPGGGEYAFLNAEQWARIRHLLRPDRLVRFADDHDRDFLDQMVKSGFETYLCIDGDPSNPTSYSFTYCARLPWRSPPEGSVSVLSATLPTEYLEQHGPGRVRELALEMASPLRFSTGHAGLAFEFLGSRTRHLSEIREELFRYPGLDVPRWGLLCRQGTRVDGVHWLNFLGRPVLGEVGGAAGLRSRLHSPGTTVQEMEGERALVTLGPWPEAGDLTQGLDLPAYRELARVLEPWSEAFSPGFVNSWRGYSEEDVRRWWRRFLD
ncbi:type VI immunity family protein [Archangium violaceum]|uniref:type VI immunity family protein n=1 Tax=Archangium violaceum TaxID=83451 RepID=UPI001EF0D0DC|nr:type VI immunity family protein [Archangium violaceum]